jgi:putative transposase
VTPFLVVPPELRRVVYTTNAIEALNRQPRKAIKTKGHFPNEEAAKKLIYLAISNAMPAWTRERRTGFGLGAAHRIAVKVFEWRETSFAGSEAYE